MKRSQDGKEENTFQRVFISALRKEVIQLMPALGPEEKTYRNDCYVRGATILIGVKGTTSSLFSVDKAQLDICQIFA